MSNRFLFTFTAGVIGGSAVTLYFNKLHRYSPTNKAWDWNWDKRHSYYMDYQNKDPINKPNGKRTITMVRHGQYHRIQGDVNDKKHLTENGKEQALITGKRFSEIGIKFDKIYCSKFTRAIETCEIIVAQLPFNNINDVIYDSDLNEGLAAMITPFNNYRTKQKYIEQVEKTSPPIKNGFNKYFHRRDKNDMDPLNQNTGNINRENILIVGHGNVFRYYLCRILQFDVNGWARYSLHNCSLSRVNIKDNGTIRVTHIGDTGHLPKRLLSNNLTQSSF